MKKLIFNLASTYVQQCWQHFFRQRAHGVVLHPAFSQKTIHLQLESKEKYYGEAIRYMDNAKECLSKAKKEGTYYHDPKYVKMACGTAYNGMLVALDCFLLYP